MALGRNISPGQGEKYYRKDDYYLEREGGEEHKLEWGGKMAEEFGLSGKTSETDWKNALNGRFPGGIEIPGGSFKDDDGNPQRRAGTDFEFSAPKSVSIQALVHGDDRLIKAHREAVTIAMAELERQVGARRGHGGKEWETTGQGLIGRVTHFTSRAGDPQLHDHVVFMNVTKNSSGQYQAMTNDRMLHYQRLTQEIYHSELSARLEKMGYTLEKGRYGEPQIKGYTRDHIEHFSQRAGAVEQYILDKWGVDWSKLSRAERNKQRFMHEEAWEMTREVKKIQEIEGLQKDWQARAREIGAEKVGLGKPVRPPSPEKRLEVARESLQFAVDHHTERESAVKEGELIRTALQAGRGKIGIEDLKKALRDAEDSGTIVRQKGDGPRQSLITSREALEREKRILRIEKEGRRSVESTLNPLQAENILNRQKEKGLKLNEEQKTAVRTILTTDNRFAGVNGYAGVGKTTMLKPAVEGLQGAGYTVVGLAPQHSAVHALEEAGIVGPRTLQSWLGDRDAGKALNTKTVVVIDEAGLVNAKDLESAMKRIEKAGARAVLVGDVKQYESVEAGPAFRQLQENGMETVYVMKMQRQRNAPENIREAARLSVDDPAKALEKLDVREIRNAEDRYRAVADEYLKSKNPSDTLVLTGTHEARRAVNAHIRESCGLVGTGRTFTIFQADDRTAAERRKIDAYETGQTIRFGKSYRSLGVEAGDTAHVLSTDRETGFVRLETPGGKEVLFDPRRFSGKGWETGRIEDIEIAPGDRVRITGNTLKTEGITNGMKGEVLGFGKERFEEEKWVRDPYAGDREKGPGVWKKEASNAVREIVRIRLDDGREIGVPVADKPLEIDHGYAQTGHSAQGLGAEKVIKEASASSPTVNRRSFYTDLTRTKEDVVLFTDDKERLTGAVQREKDKTLAHDVETSLSQGRQIKEREGQALAID